MFEQPKEAEQWKDCVQVEVSVKDGKSWIVEPASNWKPVELEKRWMVGVPASSWVIEGPG